MAEIDPKLTFDTFVVGPANRLAAAAARRAADSPGKNYNPLFIYSGSGLGKTHILAAIANRVVAVNGRRKVVYQGIEDYLEELAAALEGGKQEQMRERYKSVEILLLDDVQFLARQEEAQEMLLATLDALTAAGHQVVLASDRPPAEINELDSRLVNRFSGGLLVDIEPPEYETRVAIVKRKADEQGQQLEPGVSETIGRYPFRSVRELAGALNRILAIQDLEERAVPPTEIEQLLGPLPRGTRGGDVPKPGIAAGSDAWRTALKEAVRAAERDGYDTSRLFTLLESPTVPASWQSDLAEYQGQVSRLREIESELDRLGNPWPDAAKTVIRDPSRVPEAEALLASVRERQRPFAGLTRGVSLNELGPLLPKIALRAAEQLVKDEKPKYNPLFLWSAKPEMGRAVVGATARSYAQIAPGQRAAVTSISEFAEDFIRALSAGVAGAWRERWWTVDFLLLHGTEALADTERAQEEFFHLFEALKRRGSRILLTSTQPPSALTGVDERLRSRFEGGLVLEVPPANLPAGAADLVLQQPGDAARGGTTSSAATPARTADSQATSVETPPQSGSGWLISRERVVWLWPRIGDRVVEDLE